MVSVGIAHREDSYGNSRHNRACPTTNGRSPAKQYGKPRIELARLSVWRSPLPHIPAIAVRYAVGAKVPGVLQVAKLDNAVAVIADNYWSARKGLEAGAVSFDDGPHSSISTADVVAALTKAAEKPGAVAKNEGDVTAALANAASKVEAIYEAPFLAHATMEPMNCTVHVTADGCDIWVGTKIPTIAQRAITCLQGRVVRDREVNTLAILEWALRRRNGLKESLDPEDTPGGPLAWITDDDYDHLRGDWWPPG